MSQKTLYRDGKTGYSYLTDGFGGLSLANCYYFDIHKMACDSYVRINGVFGSHRLRNQVASRKTQGLLTRSDADLPARVNRKCCEDYPTARQVPSALSSS
jgi:hypothetical protein